ncbi:MAG: dolichyl-phosphate beta-glucosyltransferase, partial [Nitrospirota bacterium]
VSIVVPAYNEEGCIRASLNAIMEYLQTQPYKSEIIVVDDGSIDKTPEIVKEVMSKNDLIQLLKNPSNLGKGGALKKGILSSKGEYIFFTDADLAVPILFLGDFLNALQSGVDVVIGSRNVQGAKILMHQTLLRENMGKVFTWLSNVILSTNYSDFTCGFKGFKRSVAMELFGRQRIYNWSFDAEILFLARKLNHRVKEIPVTWEEKGNTKVRLLRDSVSSFIGLLRVLYYKMKGYYP